MAFRTNLFLRPSWRSNGNLKWQKEDLEKAFLFLKVFILNVFVLKAFILNVFVLKVFILKIRGLGTDSQYMYLFDILQKAPTTRACNMSNNELPVYATSNFATLCNAILIGQCATQWNRIDL